MFQTTLVIKVIRDHLSEEALAEEEIILEDKDLDMVNKGTTLIRITGNKTL